MELIDYIQHLYDAKEFSSLFLYLSTLTSHDVASFLYHFPFSKTVNETFNKHQRDIYRCVLRNYLKVRYLNQSSSSKSIDCVKDLLTNYKKIVFQFQEVCHADQSSQYPCPHWDHIFLIVVEFWRTLDTHIILLIKSELNLQFYDFFVPPISYDYITLEWIPEEKIATSTTSSLLFVENKHFIFSQNHLEITKQLFKQIALTGDNVLLTLWPYHDYLMFLFYSHTYSIDLEFKSWTIKELCHFFMKGGSKSCWKIFFSILRTFCKSELMKMPQFMKLFLPSYFLRDLFNFASPQLFEYIVLYLPNFTPYAQKSKLLREIFENSEQLIPRNPVIVAILKFILIENFNSVIPIDLEPKINKFRISLEKLPDALFKIPPSLIGPSSTRFQKLVNEAIYIPKPLPPSDPSKDYNNLIIQEQSHTHEGYLYYYGDHDYMDVVSSDSEDDYYHPSFDIVERLIE